jgi:hypothetical protein
LIKGAFAFYRRDKILSGDKNPDEDKREENGELMFAEVNRD